MMRPQARFGLGIAVALLCWLGVPAARGQAPGPQSSFSAVLGRPTRDAATLSLLAAEAGSYRVDFGSGEKTAGQREVALAAGEPVEVSLGNCGPGRTHWYRVHVRRGGAWDLVSEGRFSTCPPPGSTFVFALQGDSHPERPGKMYDPGLYERALRNVAADRPDFYLTMGDDFSIERLISRGAVTQAGVDAVYAHQRGFLGLVGASSALFLVNGNHEQAARYLLDGTEKSPAVCAGRARTRFYPLPAPDSFYSGNPSAVEHVGLPRDYYAWTWGDALFVVIDPYWHSEVAVDNEAGVQGPDQGGGGGKGGGAKREDARGKGGKRNRDLWKVTLGDEQYRWLEQTLRGSSAKFKFVFSHHVLGTGRGGVERATEYEWGGNDQRGVYRFAEMRPGWDQPIHPLMRDTGVTIFFQGHDHLYARQELDGVVYQTVPNPADPTYTAFNATAYRSGQTLPNSGHLRVTVAPQSATVEYIRAFRPQDETDDRKNGTIAARYTVQPRKPVAAMPTRATPPKGDQR